MSQSSNSKPNSKPRSRKPEYNQSIEEQTMLYWRLQAQWNGKQVPGYTWQVGDALRLLGKIAINEDMPYALRDAADELNNQIIQNKTPVPKVSLQHLPAKAEILNLPSSI